MAGVTLRQIANRAMSQGSERCMASGAVVMPRAGGQGGGRCLRMSRAQMSRTHQCTPETFVGIPGSLVTL
jgi:hypothetical protein